MKYRHRVLDFLFLLSVGPLRYDQYTVDATMTGPVPEHLKEGVIAYKSGDYARALQLLKPYADRGDAGASMGKV
jgi:hypothetical protein